MSYPNSTSVLFLTSEAVFRPKICDKPGHHLYIFIKTGWVSMLYCEALVWIFTFPLKGTLFRNVLYGYLHQ